MAPAPPRRPSGGVGEIPASATGARGTKKSKIPAVGWPTVPGATSRSGMPRLAGGRPVTSPWLRADRDGVGAELAFQQLQQGFLIRWWFWWPPVRLGAAEHRDMMLINDSQRPPVPDAFVTVTFQQGSDGVGAAELLGQLLQAGAGDEDPSAVAGC